MRAFSPCTVKYRGLPVELANVYHGWTIEDIQEESSTFYDTPLYSTWESTKNYQDTAEQISFVSLRPQEGPSTSDISIDDDDLDVDVEDEEGVGGQPGDTEASGARDWGGVGGRTMT